MALAAFDFAIEINDDTGALVFETDFDRSVSLIAEGMQNQGGAFDETDLTDGGTFTFTEDDNYNITITAIEEVTARVNKETTPEPASILGLLAVGGLGLGLKGKKQS